MSKRLKKAMIHVIDKQNGWKMVREIPVLFYPSEYTQTKSVNYPEKTRKKDESVSEYTGDKLETLEMSLFFDTYESNEDVRIYTKEITNLMEPDSADSSPPILKFVWGPINFTCVLESVTKKFTMFDKDGVPVRATLSVRFKEYIKDNAPKEKPSARDNTRVVSVKAKDSLWAISAREYGSATKWRAIAQENNIANPRLIRPGTEIAVPKYNKNKRGPCP